ncbi:MAG: cysteine synthase family protein [Myxococcota bacterium]
MLSCVGNTPLVRLRRVVPDGAAEVWVKVEGGNPTGSYKDRMALAMIEGAEADGVDFERVRVLECTGGSTGSSVAFVCAVKGYACTIISSDAYAREKLDSMRAFGAEVLIEPSVDGKITPDLWPRMLARAHALVDDGGYRFLDQFHNGHAPAGYAAMAREVLAQHSGGIDAVCGMVGTAGMIVGMAEVLRGAHPDVRVVALEPESSAVLSGGPPGAHGIDGTGAGFVPPLFRRELISEVRALPEHNARAMARRLAREEGIFAGTSTGMNVEAALQLAVEIGRGGVVLTVACDTGFKYLDGPLYRDAEAP